MPRRVAREALVWLATSAYILLMLKLALLPCAALLASLGSVPAAAHPHIFIDAGLFVDVNEEGQAIAVEVTWTYDAFYSLLIFEEFEVDKDYDGALTPDELAQLQAFDLNWIEGFEGDLYVTSDQGKAVLGAPEAVETRVENGQIVTVHRRSLGVPANGLMLRVYDPGFYSAYELTRGVEATGTCAAFIDPADIEAATSALEELLFATPQSQIEAQFPAVGESFADTVTLTCD